MFDASPRHRVTAYGSGRFVYLLVAAVGHGLNERIIITLIIISNTIADNKQKQVETIVLNSAASIERLTKAR
jgi:hypothetical protein